ncbi:4Fe-4S binding protein [Pseudescherichia vulneris]
MTPPTLNELLLWHAQYHIRGVEMALDEHPRWGMAIAALNLTLQKLDEPRWQIFPSSEAVINTSRRRLLSVRSDPKTTATVQPAPLAAAFPGFTTFTPRLDPARCILCGACSRVCRQQALIQKEDAFHIHSQVCNGCEACHAVCPTDAINVVCAVVKAGEISYPLQQARCQSCQRGFSSWDEDKLQCPICRQHHYGMR